ncbi:MAG: DUF4837 family protein [Bacteroidetes bacterium]|nr:DUF4837 family protein [Bacteroidota bacterium]MBU1114021.1 DUF4837 family protein [Bacteroidota bacterium]MBU1798963.1 DUF4837 family protein [Bacteroidota bacterium]
MKNKLLLLALITLSTIFLFSACTNSQKPAIGNEDDIIVIADSSLYYEVEAEMLHVFEKIIYTPQPENLFILKRENIEKLSQLKNRKNIIFIGSLDSQDKISTYIKQALDSSVTKVVESGEEFFINKKNLWAKDQLVMFIVANSVEELKKDILKGNEELLYSFRNISNHRLFSNLFKPRFENKKIEAELLSKYGWSIYVQPAIELAINDSSGNFVWLRSGRNTPVERWIFVHWIENANSQYLNNDSLINIRNRETKKYFRVSDDSVCVDISFGMSKPMVTQANFNEHYALMSQGFWKFSDKSGGGPFINYSYLDEKTGRFYMIDASIYAPKYYKKKLIQQADVILTSFRTIDELSEERKEEILDALE